LAVLVAEQNGCRYCVSAYIDRAAATGIAAGELAANRRAESADPKRAAALHFAAAVLDSHGRVTDAELRRVRAAGFDDGQIGEIIGYVALNCFANFFSQVARPDPDFPPVPLTTDDSYL
jgi:AhpD family alkylhydroperoxidase